MSAEEDGCQALLADAKCGRMHLSPARSVLLSVFVRVREPIIPELGSGRKEIEPWCSSGKKRGVDDIAWPPGEV